MKNLIMMMIHLSFFLYYFISNYLYRENFLSDTTYPKSFAFECDAMESLWLKEW